MQNKNRSKMKCWVISALTVFFVFSFSGLALAATFNVRANYGVNVTKNGICERVGAITIEGDYSVFAADDEIIIELMAGATVCNDIEASYNYGGLNGVEGTDPTLDYTIVGNKGEDHYTITINIPGAGIPPQSVAVGHKVTLPGPPVTVQDFSPLCFNLENTPYSEDDPNYQLVQVSYRDNRDNGYSGDRFVAMVRNSAGHTVRLCTKSEGDDVDAGGWPDHVDPKTGLVSIPLCNGDSAQNQEIGPCGCFVSERQICIKIDDPNDSFGDGEQYEFRIGGCTGAKKGVGIADVELIDPNGNQVGLNSEQRYGDSCDPLNASPVECEDMVDTKIFEFTATLNSSGEHYLLIDVAYDSCEASIGDWIVDISGQRIPCGDSFRVKDLLIAKFVDCGTGLQSQQIFPYSADVSTGWWSGVALTNPNDSDITVEMEIYEADGDKYTAAVDVPAKNISVGLMNDSAFIQLTPHSDDASFGDERFWILARAPKPFYGFLMMGDSAQAQGYLSVDYESVNF